MLGISPIRVCMNGVFFPVNVHAMLNVNYTYRCMNGCLHDPKYVMHNVCVLHVQRYAMQVPLFVCSFHYCHFKMFEQHVAPEYLELCLDDMF